MSGSGLTRVTDADYGEFDPAWSPDGVHIAFSANTTGSLSKTSCCRLGIVNISSGNVAFVTSAIGAVRPDYSPSGSLLVFDTPTGVFTMPASGGTPTLRASGGRDAAFSPDGQRIVYLAGNTIRSVSASGGSATTLYSTTRALESPAWIGDRIYFVEHAGAGYDGRLSVSHRSISSSGGGLVVERNFGQQVAELSIRKLTAARVAGRFTNDDQFDLANYDPASGDWLVSRSTGSGFSNNVWGTLSPATGWSDHLVGDFNNDGRDDIGNYRPASGNWAVSRSTGGGFSSTVWTTFSTKSGWTSQVVGDFNNSGGDDIANYHPSTGKWVVSRSTGSSFTNDVWTTFSTKSGWTSQLVGDFNNSGGDDIANYHPSTGKWVVSRSTGSSFTNDVWTTFSTKSGWTSPIGR